MHDFRLYEDSVISEINRKHKADSVLPNGFRYIYFENIDSTNKYAKEHAGELENAIIVAENQYAGVGKFISLVVVTMSIDTGDDYAVD